MALVRDRRKAGPDLIDAYDRLKDVEGAPCLVVFAMEGCKSCAIFEDDLSHIARIDAFDTVLLVTVSPQDGASRELAGHFGVREFPTAFVLHRGQPVGGWAGYDKINDTGERRTRLAAMVDRVLERASDAAGKTG